jgi:hypothetical protein
MIKRLLIIITLLTVVIHSYILLTAREWCFTFVIKLKGLDWDFLTLWDLEYVFKINFPFDVGLDQNLVCTIFQIIRSIRFFQNDYFYFKKWPKIEKHCYAFHSKWVKNNTQIRISIFWVYFYIICCISFCIKFTIWSM